MREVFHCLGNYMKASKHDVKVEYSWDSFNIEHAANVDRRGT